MIYGNELFPEQTGVGLHVVEQAECSLQCLAVRFDETEVADGVGGGLLATGESEQFDVPDALCFQSARRAQTVQISVAINVEQEGGGIGWGAAFMGFGVCEAQFVP